MISYVTFRGFSSPEVSGSISVIHLICFGLLISTVQRGGTRLNASNELAISETQKFLVYEHHCELPLTK